MPLYEQPLGSHFKLNDRLKILITDVRDTPKGPQIILSRKTPNLVVKLFEQEVPEIADSTVKILGVAREAGVRTKIAVNSSSADVDPVGACVGMKGSRVQMVVRELDNEKIDIVPYSVDPIRFITAALNPAKIQAIHLNDKEKRAEVIVAMGNLAIAMAARAEFETGRAPDWMAARYSLGGRRRTELRGDQVRLPGGLPSANHRLVEYRARGTSALAI